MGKFNQKDLDLRFRTTHLWPGIPIPVPPVVGLGGTHVRGDWIINGLSDAQQEQGFVEPHELPQGFYLRELMETPPDDLEAAAHLVRNYGALLARDMADLPVDFMAQVPEIPERQGDGYHLAEVSTHLSWAQSVVTTWLAAQEPDGLADLVSRQVTTEHLQWLRETDLLYEHHVHDLDDLRYMLVIDRIYNFEATVNAALRRFAPGFDEPDFREPTLYSLAFLQLYNDMVERAQVKHCMNEPCRRPFVRQRGRAEYGQYRAEGVKYCSRECARSQAQRELRRRKRQAG
jgi:hypothetical protein